MKGGSSSGRVAFLSSTALPAGACISSIQPGPLPLRRAVAARSTRCLLGASVRNPAETEVDGVVVRRTIKVRFWDKVAALDKAMRLLGLYERDNTQQRENLSLQVCWCPPNHECRTTQR
jgi:hypothetical protein